MYRRVPPPRWHLSDALLISTFGVMSFEKLKVVFLKVKNIILKH